MYDLLKFNYQNYANLSNLGEVIASYEKVLEKKPQNKSVLKNLVLLYHLEENENKKRDVLNKLKDNNHKDDALIKISYFFIESGKCGLAYEFYDQTKQVLNNELVLASFKQKIDNKCGLSNLLN